MRSPSLAYVQAHALHMHTHVTATAAYQKKAQIYLDPSALLIKKLLMSRVNKSLAPRRCST